MFKLNVPLPTTGLVVESVTPAVARVGFGETPITTPLAVMALPPLLVMLPANVALDVVIFVLVPVNTVGTEGENTSISSKDTPSKLPLASEPKRKRTFTFACPFAPINGVTEVIHPLT